MNNYTYKIDGKRIVYQDKIPSQYTLIDDVRGSDFKWSADHGKLYLDKTCKKEINDTWIRSRKIWYSPPAGTTDDVISVKVDGDPKTYKKEIKISSYAEDAAVNIWAKTKAFFDNPIITGISGSIGAILVGLALAVLTPRVVSYFNGDENIAVPPPLETPSPTPTQAPSREVTIPPSPLISPTPVDVCRGSNFQTASGLDYGALCNYLRNNEWVAASQETDRLLRTLMGSSDTNPEQLISSTAIRSISCDDLKTIDALWSQFSDRYSFTDQKEVWNSILNIPVPETRDPTFFHPITFGQTVGWFDNNGGRKPQAEINNPASPTYSEKGHFPDLGAGWSLSEQQGAQLPTLWQRFDEPACQ